MLGGTTNTVNSTIDTASNRLLSEHFAFTHDGAGNRTSQSWAGTTATYGFDHFNRLRSVSRDAAVTYENPDSGTVSLSAGNSAYLYSALDERVQKTALGTTTTFIPSGPGQLLAENKGGTWTNYLWFNGELVGIQRAGTTYYSFNDHLGRPEQLRDSNQSVVRQSLSGAFSRRILQDNIGGLNIGFPGQYYDAESDLWQNGFRDYDARNGRYIETDPLGLVSDRNLYAYVKGNALRFVDALGLCEEDHKYEDKTFSPCSPTAAFNALKQPSMSAPGAPVTKEGFTSPVVLWGNDGNNRISQYVDSETRTIINTTLKGHQFYPGTVVWQVDRGPGGYGSTITITGTGTGPNPMWNNLIGLAYFPNTAAVAAVLCMFGGKQ